VLPLPHTEPRSSLHIASATVSKKVSVRVAACPRGCFCGDHPINAPNKAARVSVTACPPACKEVYRGCVLDEHVLVTTNAPNKAARVSVPARPQGSIVHCVVPNEQVLVTTDTPNKAARVSVRRSEHQ
jgi:hypothetical protein